MGFPVLFRSSDRGVALSAIATTGESNVAVVLVDVESLSALTAGASSTAVGLTGVVLLGAASQGASTDQVSLSAVGALIGATAGSSAVDVALEGNTVKVGRPSGGSARPYVIPLRAIDEDVVGRIIPIGGSTSGSSSVDVELSTYRELETFAYQEDYDDELLLMVLAAA